MQTLYEVRANHPIAKRIDETRLTAQEKNDLVAELEKAGYEFKDIDVQSHNYYEDGDEIVITKRDYDNGSDRGRELIRYMNSNEKLDLRSFLANLQPDEVIMIGKISSQRMNRFMGQLVIEWKGQGLKEDWKTTNTHWLENTIDGMGLRFIHPEFEQLSIMNCEDKYLHERELVIKTYALQNGLPEKESEFLIGIVESAMSKHGIVFYQP